jgi:7,8-dihydropterin-6-yl-methyl-4-(beta-D-ribofuranosyl)aminobenzene 5'-phosphate synthase
MRSARLYLALAMIFLLPVFANAQGKVHELEIHILSTQVVEDGLGEWGFSALVIADGHKILYDTGTHEDVVLRNLHELNVSLSDVQEVILSHHHNDHIGGLIALRKDAVQRNPDALARAYVAKGFFTDRKVDGVLRPQVRNLKVAYEATGGKFVEIDGLRELYPGVWLTGPVPRKYPEHNWDGHQMLVQPDGSLIDDNLPEDQALVIDTVKGLVVLTGCGHAGIVNISEYARDKVRKSPLYAVVGGIHLYNANQQTIHWTASKLKEFQIQNLIGAHCTGVDTLYELRELLGLNRQTATVGPVGSVFRLNANDQSDAGTNMAGQPSAVAQQKSK